MWLLVAFGLLPGAETSVVTVAPRETLSVTIAGEGPAVVFVPGLCGSAYAFRKPFQAAVGAGFRAVVIEPLGLGSSARPVPADYSLTAQATRLEAVLDSLRCREAILVTQSLATSLALRLAVRRPDLVAGIVSLEGGAAESMGTPGFRKAMQIMGLVGKLGGTGFLRGRLEKQLRSASADPGWVDAAAVEGYAAAAFTDLSATLDAARAMAKAVEPEPLRPQLPRVACPVELLLGIAPHEGGVPANELQILRANLRDLRVVAVPGAGTFIAEERPEAVLLSIRRIHRRALPKDGVVAARGTTSELQ